MKKENLIAQLEGAKTLSSQVDIDKVIELLEQLDPEIVVETKLGMSVELAEEIANKIERCLDYNSDQLVDVDSAEFELDWNNVIRLSRVDVYVNEIMDHVTASLDSFVVEVPEEEEDGFIQAQQEAAEAAEEGILTDVNQDLVELERGDNPHDTAYEATLAE